jgi:hypothetical protein
VADRDEALVRALRDLARTLDTGPVPNVTPRVLARIAGTVPRRPLLGRVGGRLRVLLGGLLVGALASVPAVRSAAADVVAAVIRLPGVVIHAGDEPSPQPSPPSPPAVPAPSGPAGPVAGPLGREIGYTRAPVPLASARSQAMPVVRLPGGLGPPDEAYVLGPGGRVVSLLWATRPGLPALPGSRIGLLVDAVVPTDDAVFQKYIGAMRGDPVTVAGRPGIWIGGPHELLPIGDDGVPDYDADRTARATLVVALPGATVRIESGLDRDAAVHLAATLR